MRVLVVLAMLGVASPAFADDAVTAGVSWSQFGDNSAGTVSAPYIAGEVGYRTSATDAVGVRVEWSRLTGFAVRR